MPKRERPENSSERGLKLPLYDANALPETTKIMSKVNQVGGFLQEKVDAHHGELSKQFTSDYATQASFNSSAPAIGAAFVPITAESMSAKSILGLTIFMVSTIGLVASGLLAYFTDIFSDYGDSTDAAEYELNSLIEASRNGASLGSGRARTCELGNTNISKEATGSNHPTQVSIPSGSFVVEVDVHRDPFEADPLLTILG